MSFHLSFSPPFLPPLPPQAPAIPPGLMLALATLDDAALRREYDAHADLAAGDEGGERRMSKDGLAQFMRAKGLAHSDVQVERVMTRMDTNADGEIDFDEFRALARANADLEQVLRSKHFECAVAAFFPSGTTFEDVGKMDHAQFSAVVDQSRGAQIQQLVELGAQLAAVTSAQHAAAGGGKFTSELQGGTLADFYAGVTGLCGEPDADLEAGMRREHTECDDSDVAFSTPNYGIRTTPRTEFELVAAGGSGCERAEGVEEGVVVTGTRGCFKASGLKWCKASLCSDPTAPDFTLGLEWQDVGAAEPAEGRRLTNAKLQDALASKMAMQFAQEELDAFRFTDLRSTDFVEAGGRYFRPAASRAQILENAGLADALTRQTEFTQREWDAFGVRGLRMSHLVKAGDAYYRPAGTEEQKDVRVLRSLAHYGAFRKDGRLAWDVGDEVAVGEQFAVKVDGRIGKGDVVQAANDPSKQGVVEEDDGSNFMPYKVRWEDGTLSDRLYQEDIAAVPLQKEVKGTVLEFNDEGAANLDFGKGRKGIVSQWVPKDQFYRLHPLPSERDTPIQRQVKLARLRRCDVTALVMYTGECSCGVRELTCTRACIL